MAEAKPGQAKYAEQPGLFSPDIGRQPIVDHLQKAKELERARLGLIDKGGMLRPATLGDAERSLHTWWEDFTDEVLSTLSGSVDLDRIEDVVNRSKDPTDLFKALVLALPQKDSEERERRLDLSERIADKIAEIAPNSRSHYAQHQAQRARETAMGIKVPLTTQEGIRQAIREGRELLGYTRKPRRLPRSA